jgi:probable HAF family extracellular repeat protein
VRERLFERPIALAFAILCATSCSDSTQPHDKGTLDAQKIRQGLLVSAPIVSRSGASASGDVVDAPVVFVSMPPGTLTDGDSVRVTPTNGQSVSEAMGDGGFDPLPVSARIGDSLDVTVFASGAANRVRMGISALRQPSVVRTTPARGRTDVPLNQRIVIVFSQPLSGATVTPSSIQLSLNGAPVSANLTLQPGEPWVVLLSPTAPLAPSTTYQLSVVATVADANGATLVAPYTATFTTGSATDVVASVIVGAPDGYSHFRVASAAIASPGGKAKFVAQELSSGGDTLVNTGIVWSTSDPSIATVAGIGAGNDSATATAIATGEAAVIACAGTLCGHATLTVQAPAAGLAPTTEIGDLGGGDSRVWDMKGGVVGGSSLIAGGACTHAFLWSSATGMEDLGTLPGQCNSAVTHMNDNGVVLGAGDFAGPRGEPTFWIWTRATGMQPIPLPDTVNFWQPISINGAGEIVFSDDTVPEAILGTDGHFRRIATSIPNATVEGLNDRDHAIISLFFRSDTNFCGTVAYIWDAIADRQIRSLSATDSSGAAVHLCANFINNADVVAGNTATTNDDYHAFRWTAAKGFEFLRVAPDITTEAAQLNENGDLSVYLFSKPTVGADTIYQVDGAIWKADGTLIRLGGLGGNHTTANGFTNSNIVAGHSQSGSNTGPLHAVLWDLSAATAAQLARATAKPSARSTRVGNSAATAGRSPVLPNAMSRRPRKY